LYWLSKFLRNLFEVERFGTFGLTQPDPEVYLDDDDDDDHVDGVRLRL
jgi:hypothetical protein